MTDVTPLTLFKFVKSVSSERDFVPVLSEACLLWILQSIETSEDDIFQSTTVEIEQCIDQILKTANHIAERSQLRIDADDWLLKNGIENQCANLSEAVSELSMFKQQLQDSGDRNITSRIVQSASDVCLAIWKILNAYEEVKIKKITFFIEKMKKAVLHTQRISSEKEYFIYLKTMENARGKLVDICEEYYTDLLDVSLREIFTEAVHNIMCSVANLTRTLRRGWKQSENSRSESHIEDKIVELWSCLSKLSVIVNYPATLHYTGRVQKPGSCVTNIEKILMAYSESSRYCVTPDVEVWMGRIVEHSLIVACLCHVCQPDYKYLILDNCRRLLEANRRAIKLSVIVSARMSCLQIRNDLETVQETVKDEVLELEENVNLALVGLIVEVFTETTQPIESLAEAIICTHQGKCYQVADPLVSKFIHHSSQICQIALLVAACYSDAEGIKQIESAVCGLKKFQVDAVVAVRTVGQQECTDVVQYMDAVVEGWSLHLSSLLHVLYDIMEPEVFMEISGKAIHNDICISYTCLLCNDEKQAAEFMQRLINRSKQCSHCACQTINNSADGIFRNGFQVYVNQLNSAINAIQDVNHYLLHDLCNLKYKEVIETHLNNLHKAIKGVRLAVSKDNHPDILDPMRETGITKIEVNSSASDHVPDCLQKLLPIKPVARHIWSAPKSHPSENLPKLNIQQTPTLLPMSNQCLTSKRGLSSFIVTDLASSTNKNIILPDAHSQLHLSDLNETQYLPPPAKPNCLPVPWLPAAKPNIGEKQHLRGKYGRLRKHVNGEISTAAELVSSFSNKDMLSSLNTQVQTLPENLIKAVTIGDKDEIHHLLTDILRWTNHIVEAAQNLLHHGNVIGQKSELENLCSETDSLASKIFDTAKSIFPVDEQTQDILLTDCKAWSMMLDKACVVVDEVVADWKSSSDCVFDSAVNKDQNQLESQLDVLVSHQQAMTDLVSKASSYSISHNMTCQSALTVLKEKEDDLSDVTVTIKTVSNALSQSDTSDDVYGVQLCELCRDWAVTMFCSQCCLETMSAEMMAEGSKILGLKWTELTDNKELFEKLDEETSAIGGLLDCISVGSEEKKRQSSELVSQITSVLEEIEVCLQDISQLSKVPHSLKSRKDVLTGQWVIKMIEANEFVKEESNEFLKVLDHFEARANDLCSLSKANNDGIDSADELRLEFNNDLKQLTNNMLSVEKKVLLAIKISPNLLKRDLIGRYLNELTSLTQTLVSRLNSLATGTHSSLDYMDPEISQLKLQWVAKMKRLILTLEKMPDIRTSLIPEIKKLINSSMVRCTEHLEKKIPETKPALNNVTDKSNVQQSKDNSPDVNNMEEWKKEVSNEAAITETGNRKRNSSHPDTGCIHLYSDSDYIPWANDSNAVVKLSRRITEDTLVIQQYCRGGEFNIDSINRLCEKAESIAENGLQMEKCFHVLVDYCGNSLVGELVKRTELIATYSSQLQVIANALKNSSKTSQTVLILLHNSKNLVAAIQEAFVTAEVVCVKGLQKPLPDVCTENESILDLVTCWQKTLLEHRANEVSSALVDELGLRRVDHLNSPSLTDVLKIQINI